MIYHLLYPLSDQFSILNVFRYITFRSIYAMLTALILSIIIGPTCINRLRKLKFGQQIKECGPDHQSKSGTPTMGGLLFGFCMLLSVLLWGDLTNKFVWLTIMVFVGFGAVGFTDDFIKVVRKHNDGLSPGASFWVSLSSAWARSLCWSPSRNTRRGLWFRFSRISSRTCPGCTCPWACSS